LPSRYHCEKPCGYLVSQVGVEAACELARRGVHLPSDLIRCARGLVIEFRQGGK
jgi:hypothetical protein